MSNSIIKKISIILLAVRPQFFQASVIPVLLGTAVSYYQNMRVNMILLMITLTGILFIHAGLNLANDYFDFKSGTDDINNNYNAFSGGSRFIQNGILSPRQIIIFSVTCFSAGSLIGLYINYILPGNTVLLIGIAGVFLAFFYSAGPLKIGYTGFGELSTAIGFGPLITAGSFYVQSQKLSYLPLNASVPVALLTALILIINGFPDYESDKISGKKTLVVLLGKKNSTILYTLLISIMYMWITAGVLLEYFPSECMTALITIPAAIRTVLIIRKNYNNTVSLLPANALTIIIHLITGLLFVSGFIINSVIAGI
ncbi:MAG: 1,4-dihydroxy-2-naphthoate octaprenyltransferase [Spirochaetes bacterium]|nr:1,4-dihydroxy-2-naphthoate octaprenyltransferase [Spirochaetota bacterium]